MLYEREILKIMVSSCKIITIIILLILIKKNLIYELKLEIEFQIIYNKYRFE